VYFSDEIGGYQKIIVIASSCLLAMTEKGPPNAAFAMTPENPTLTPQFPPRMARSDAA